MKHWIGTFCLSLIGWMIIMANNGQERVSEKDVRSFYIAAIVLASLTATGVWGIVP